MPSPTFATPLPQSPRSEILEWRFPRPYHNLVLTGRSRAAWHTSFVIPQLNLLLDAGLVVNNLRPKHIFLTHGHSDHVLLAPAFVKKDDPPDIFCPAEMEEAFDAFVNAKTLLNKTGGLPLPPFDPSSSVEKGEGEEGQEEEEEEEEDDDEKLKAGKGNGRNDGKPPPKTSAAAVEAKAAAAQAFAGVHPLLRTHVTHPLRAGDPAVPLRRTSSKEGAWTAEPFACDHSVPCLGYLFSAVTHRLRPELRGLPGEQLRALRERDGPGSLTRPVRTPVFAFLGDTTAATLAAGPWWLTGDGEGEEEGPVRVVITECSFLREEHRPQADRTKHTIWGDLEKVVRRFPRTVFVLTHFSLRYSDGEVRRFFEQMGDAVPANVVVWVDGGGGPGGGGGVGGTVAAV